MGSGSRGGIVSYAARGRQFILATSGFSGWVAGMIAGTFPGMSEIPGGGIVVAFALE